MQDPRQYNTSFKIKNTDFAKVPSVLSDVLQYLKTAQGVDKLLPMSAKLQALGDSSVTIGVTVSLHTPQACYPTFLAYLHPLQRQSTVNENPELNLQTYVESALALLRCNFW